MIRSLPYTTLFLSSMLISTFMACSAPNMIILWAALEINTLSFIPLMTSSNMNHETEAATKYFLAQAMGSALILITAVNISHSPELIMSYKTANVIMTLGLLIKLGVAPAHFWFPSVMADCSWTTCFLLSTWQKIIPLVMLSILMFPNINLLMFVVSSSAMVGGIGGINQTQLRPLLAYSSIIHMSWIMSSMFLSPSMAPLYFLMYTTSSLMIIALFINHKSLSIKDLTQSMIIPPSQLIFLSIALLSIGGIPPLLGFPAKVGVLTSLLNNSHTFTALILVLSSTISVSYYLNLILSLLLSQKSKKYLNTHENSSWIALTPLFFLTSAMFLLI